MESTIISKYYYMECNNLYSDIYIFGYMIMSEKIILSENSGEYFTPNNNTPHYKENLQSDAILGTDVSANITCRLYL